MSTDVIQRTTEALVAVLDADLGVQALTGRTSRNCLPARDGVSVQRPVLVYQFLSAVPRPGAADFRRVQYRITAWAMGNGAQRTANGLAERVELAITQPNLVAQGLDAFPETTPTRAQGPLPETPAGEAIARADVTLTLTVRKD